MDKKNLVLAWGVVLAAALAGMPASAQQIRPSYSYPATNLTEGYVRLGDSPVFMSPYVGASVGHDDNVLLAPTHERSSTVYLLSPGVRFDARGGNSVFQAAYQGQAAHYTSSDDDDYVDHAASLQYDVAFSSRSFLRLGYVYARSHDPRGSTDRPVSNSPDKFRVSAPNVTYAYGAPGARGRVELYYVQADRTYLNNHEFTASSDRDTKEYGGAFYVRVAPKTYALVEARQTDIGYKQANPFDGNERRYFAGVSWEATALTTGTLKVGRMRRSFDSGAPDNTSTSWEGIVTWSPLTYSSFDLRTARYTTESTGLGSFIISSATAVQWNHAWNSRFSSSVLARYQKDQYQGFDRTDDTTTLGFKVGYRFRRWLTFGAEFNHTKRDSNLPQFEYDKNVYLLTATGTL